jgi:hypothetical protein
MSIKRPDLNGIMNRAGTMTGERQDRIPGSEGQSMLGNGLLERFKFKKSGGNRE